MNFYAKAQSREVLWNFDLVFLGGLCVLAPLR
jgi:hypothetical protein